MYLLYWPSSVHAHSFLQRLRYGLVRTRSRRAQTWTTPDPDSASCHEISEPLAEHTSLDGVEVQHCRACRPYGTTVVFAKSVIYMRCISGVRYVMSTVVCAIVHLCTNDCSEKSVSPVSGSSSSVPIVKMSHYQMTPATIYYIMVAYTTMYVINLWFIGLSVASDLSESSSRLASTIPSLNPTCTCARVRICCALRQDATLD